VPESGVATAQDMAQAADQDRRGDHGAYRDVITPVDSYDSNDNRSAAIEMGTESQGGMADDNMSLADSYMASGFHAKAVASYVRGAQIAEPIDPKLWSRGACGAVSAVEMMHGRALNVADETLDVAFENAMKLPWMASPVARLATLRRCIATDDTFRNNLMLFNVLALRSVELDTEEEMRAVLAHIRPLASDEGGQMLVDKLEQSYMSMSWTTKPTQKAQSPGMKLTTPKPP
jgi:hypothetical protein